MSRLRIPLDERPSTSEMKAHRQTVLAKAKEEASAFDVDGEFVELLQTWMENVPAHVIVDMELSEVSKDACRIVHYTMADVIEARQYVKKLRGKFLALGIDGTFDTNRKHYVQVQTGPLVPVAHDNAVRIGYHPSIEVLAHREDTEAIKAGNSAFQKHVLDPVNAESPDKEPLEVTDVCVDGNLALKNASEILFRNAHIHRDLWHIKKDLRKSSSRLTDKNFAAYLAEVATASAWSPSRPEFFQVWHDVVSRMEDTEDWNEDSQADFLSQWILKFTDSGEIFALWESGLHAMPAGLTAYAEGSVECNHRHVKRLLPHPFRFSDTIVSIKETCRVKQNLVEEGKYALFGNLSTDVPLPWLIHSKRRRQSGRIGAPDSTIQEAELTTFQIEQHFQDLIQKQLNQYHWWWERGMITSRFYSFSNGQEHNKCYFPHHSPAHSDVSDIIWA